MCSPQNSSPFKFFFFFFFCIGITCPRDGVEFVFLLSQKRPANFLSSSPCIRLSSFSQVPNHPFTFQFSFLFLFIFIFMYAVVNPASLFTAVFKLVPHYTSFRSTSLSSFLSQCTSLYQYRILPLDSQSKAYNEHCYSIHTIHSLHGHLLHYTCMPARRTAIHA